MPREYTNPPRLVYPRNRSPGARGQGKRSIADLNLTLDEHLTGDERKPPDWAPGAPVSHSHWCEECGTEANPPNGSYSFARQMWLCADCHHGGPKQPDYVMEESAQHNTEDETGWQ